jgi:jumonji domain-containing protein 2
LTSSDGIDRLNLDQRETLFWDNICKKRNIYGSEVEATLFDKNLKIFNMSHLNDPVSIERDLRNNRINGVNTPFLYVGSFGTSFAFHVEDYNLYSTSYLHVGDPKTWYIIPPRDGLKFERFAKRYLREYCEDAIQHKIFMPSPFAIKENGINFGKIRQCAGEFVVTFPFAYHGGFNNGFNIAEAINFGTRYWYESEYGYKSSKRKCHCGDFNLHFSFDNQTLKSLI